MGIPRVFRLEDWSKPACLSPGLRFTLKAHLYEKMTCFHNGEGSNLTIQDFNVFTKAASKAKGLTFRSDCHKIELS